MEISLESSTYSSQDKFIQKDYLPAQEIEWICHHCDKIYISKVSWVHSLDSEPSLCELYYPDDRIFMGEKHYRCFDPDHITMTKLQIEKYKEYELDLFNIMSKFIHTSAINLLVLSFLDDRPLYCGCAKPIRNSNVDYNVLQNMYCSHCGQSLDEPEVLHPIFNKCSHEFFDFSASASDIFSLNQHHPNCTIPNHICCSIK